MSTESDGVELDRSILHGNCATEEGPEAFIHAGSEGTISFQCSVVDTSGVAVAGEWIIDSESVADDPLFCDPAPCDLAYEVDGDYTVDAASPALAGPCAPIGAEGHGCGVVGTTPTSWGRVRAPYRIPGDGR